jgi:hypothetical protein
MRRDIPVTAVIAGPWPVSDLHQTGAVQGLGGGSLWGLAGEMPSKRIEWVCPLVDAAAQTLVRGELSTQTAGADSAEKSGGRLHDSSPCLGANRTKGRRLAHAWVHVEVATDARQPLSAAKAFIRGGNAGPPQGKSMSIGQEGAPGPLSRGLLALRRVGQDFLRGTSNP